MSAEATRLAIEEVEFGDQWNGHRVVMSKQDTYPGANGNWLIRFENGGGLSLPRGEEVEVMRTVPSAEAAVLAVIDDFGWPSHKRAWQALAAAIVAAVRENTP